MWNRGMRKQMMRVAMMMSMGVSPLAFADTAWLEREDVKSFVDHAVKTQQINRNELEQLIVQATPRPEILRFFDRPSTSRPWYQFRQNFVVNRLIEGGAKFWSAHETALRQASEKYGVAPEVMVAILGVETQYGAIQGSYRVLDVVSTIAFDYPRRAEYFQGELTNFLQLVKEEQQPALSFKGSYAGAMGMPQFMPSSFRRWAVDGDGDGRRDIWGTPADAIFSIANYLREHGWERGAPVVLKANIEQNQSVDDILAHRFELNYTLLQFNQRGIFVNRTLPSDTKALLFSLELSPENRQYFVGLQNFYTITRYNKSIHYAMAVHELSERILQTRKK